MWVFALPSVSMQDFNLFHCQSTPGTYFRYICQSDPRLYGTYVHRMDTRSAHIFQLASIVCSIKYIIFSHVHVFPSLAITPIVLDYYVASQDVYLLYCTFICMYLLKICIGP